MLVLRRKKGETIRVGDDVLVTVIDIGARCVRIGITAPLSTRVDREEIWRLRQDVSAARTDAEGSQGAFDCSPRLRTTEY